MPITGLGYLVLRTTDVDGWVAFATEVLGLYAEPPDRDGVVALRMDDRAARFFLEPGVDEGLAAIGWEVDHADDLVGLATALSSAGRPVRRENDDGCRRRHVEALLHTEDPDGAALELLVAPHVAATAFTSARGLGAFRTGELGLGHLVVAVDDLPSKVAFYRDVLGFRLSDRLGEALYFLRCNPRHHSIGIASIGGKPRLLHVMLELEHLDDVGATLDLCIERGIRVSSLGLHTNDRMTSFYLQTPSGFEIELGWNGLLVDEHTWEVGEIDSPSIWGHHQLDPAHPPGARAFRKVKAT